MPTRNNTAATNRFASIFSIFLRVRAFVARKFPELEKTQLEAFCLGVERDRKKRKGLLGRRSFAHVGHRPGKICTWYPAAKGLSKNHLYGLFLHEFGHIAAGHGEMEADRWVFVHFGIAIEYRGNWMLEWVSPETVKARGI
jgi:hypothetical protein